MSSDALKTLTAGPLFPRWAVLGTMALATAVRAGVLLWASDNLGADPDGYTAVAENLVAHGTLGHGEVPTAKRPPLYPLLLAACVALGPWCRAAIGGLHLAMGVATVWLVLLLGRRAGLRWGAPAAALLVACDPILLWQSTLVMTETAAALLCAAGLLALAVLSARPAPGRAAAAGAVLGLAGMCRPELLLFGAAAGVVVAFSAIPRRVGIKTAAALAAGACLVLAPWTVRNWLQFGRPIVTTTHGGYTLLLANNENYYRHLREHGWFAVWEAGSSFQRQLLWHYQTTDDELACDSAAYYGAFRDIAADPAMFLASSGIRVGKLWQLVPHRLPPGERPVMAIRRYMIGAWYAAEFLLAAIGLWAVFRRRWGSASLRHTLAWGVLMAAVLTAVHAFYWTDMRMRAPLMPMAALAAAAGAACLAARVGRHKSIGGNRL